MLSLLYSLPATFFFFFISRCPPLFFSLFSQLLYFFRLFFWRYVCRSLSSLQTHTTTVGFWIQTFPETHRSSFEGVGYSPTMRHVGRVCRGKPHNNLMRQHTTLWSMCVILFVCNSMWAVSVAVVAVWRNRLALHELFGLWCRRWSLLISFSPHFLSHKHVVMTLMSFLL